MPDFDDLTTLGQLLFDLRTKVAEQTELGLTIDEVSVFFPVDCVEYDLGTEFVCFVEGLFVKPERTPEVRQKLADSIREVLVSFARECVPTCQMVEVLVKQFNPEKDGFAKSTIPKY
jgi:hypothetical protein